MSDVVDEKRGSLVPKLRFPEFSNRKPWTSKPLEKLLTYERPDAYIVAETNYIDIGTPVLTANKSFILGYTSEETGVYTDTPAVIFDDFTTDSKYVDFSFKVKSSAIKILKPIDRNNLRFIYGAFSTINFTPSAHKRHYISVYQKQSIGIPLPDEQHKIADCLTSLDDLIAAIDARIDTLNTHKQGLLQWLFPRDGATVPRLRFAEFNDADKWNLHKLEELAKRGSGHTPNKQHPEYYNGGIKWISLADSKNLDNGYIFQTDKEISEEGIRHSSAVLHPAGTVILSRDAGVGRSAIMFSPMAVSQHFT